MLTKFKLQWLKKNENKYRSTVNKAYKQVRAELIDFINDYTGYPDAFIKYMIAALNTSDIETFIYKLKYAIKLAKQCKNDPLANRSAIICRIMLLKLHILSKFTIKWTKIDLQCPKCRKVSKHSFLYSNKLCPHCGSIILK
jgi:hypothetical protein